MEFNLLLAPPVHGWLPVRICLDEQIFEFEASDGANNPVQDMVDSATAIERGEATLIIFWLEPGVYEIATAPSGEKLHVRLLFAEDIELEERIVLASRYIDTGAFLSTLKREITRFIAFGASDPHWTAVALELER